YCSYVGEYVVAFLLRILIIYLMGIFCFTKYCNYVGAPIAIGGSRLSFENPVSNQTGFLGSTRKPVEQQKLSINIG
ncbi:hypothetical protein, partial [Flavobacterium aquidurense]|uniref:hypothetical protein n=1 Tax=Flavobacterium aquidurense TaxID=362413 RepID=UPI00371A9FA1